MTPPVRAVVFDLDGTLIDSMPLVLRAYRHALAPFRVALSDDELLAHMGGPPERIFGQMLTERADIDGATSRLNDFGAENWKLVRPFDGMSRLLDGLRAAGGRIGVWTGRDRASTEWLLREHGIGDRIDVCVCGDDLASHKPDPAGLVETLGRLGAGTDEALFVGDAAVDVLAGAAAGVRTLLIAHGRPTPADLGAKAWRVVATPAEAYARVHDEIRGNPRA